MSIPIPSYISLKANSNDKRSQKIYHNQAWQEIEVRLSLSLNVVMELAVV